MLPDSKPSVSTPRKNLTKRLRYEVLRRDNHACRYCGATAPDVKLTVDHVVPVALGGSDDPSNLVAACVDCNAGKSSAAADQSLVEDVSARALRWAAAIKQAAADAEAQIVRQWELHGSFNAVWNGFAYGPDWNRQKVPRPDDWEQSITTFSVAGLTESILDDAVRRAMASRAMPDQTWRYFCGICWNKIKALQDAALAAVDDGSDD